MVVLDVLLYVVLFPGLLMGVSMGQAVRTPDQILRSVISYCEFRAGESWRNLFDPAQRHDPERWDWLDAARLCESVRYAPEERIAPVLPRIDEQPSPSPLEVLFRAKPKSQLVDALMMLDPVLTDRALLHRLPRPKLASMLARAYVAAGAGKRETVKNHPATDGVGMTQAEIAFRLGISKQRVDQIEKAALNKLRKKAPQSVTLLMALAGELDRERARRSAVQPDDSEDAA